MEMERSLLKREATAGIQEMQEEGFENESVPTASLTRNMKRKTALSKMVKQIALMNFIYDADIRNLKTPHMLVVCEDYIG